MTLPLIAGWNVAKQHGRTALRAYHDFGMSLRGAIALYRIENDCGERTETWAEWLKQHLGISETEAKDAVRWRRFWPRIQA